MAWLWRLMTSPTFKVAALNSDMLLPCSRAFKWVPACPYPGYKNGAMLLYLTLAVLPITELPMKGVLRGAKSGVGGLNCLQGTVQISIFNLWKFQADGLLVSHAVGNQSWLIFCYVQVTMRTKTGKNWFLSLLGNIVFNSLWVLKWAQKFTWGCNMVQTVPWNQKT